MENDSQEKMLLTAGYCGLACKACSVYIASCIGGIVLEQRAKRAKMTAEEIRCTGCRSDKTSPYCTKCEIKRCIREKKLEWCSECNDYPCSKLTAFQASMPHRAEILESLDYAKEHTLKEWDTKMEKDLTCIKCGTYNSIYADSCRTCGESPVNAYAKRHEDRIHKSAEKAISK